MPETESEQAYHQFSELMKVRTHKKITEAYALLSQKPSLVLWMDSAEMGFEASEAIQRDLPREEAIQLHTIAKEYIDGIREPSMKELEVIVEKSEPYPPKDLDYAPAYNNFLDAVKRRDYVAAYALFDGEQDIPHTVLLGCGLYCFNQFVNDAKVGAEKGVRFLKTLREAVIKSQEIHTRVDELIHTFETQKGIGNLLKSLEEE